MTYIVTKDGTVVSNVVQINFRDGSYVRYEIASAQAMYEICRISIQKCLQSFCNGQRGAILKKGQSTL